MTKDGNRKKIGNQENCSLDLVTFSGGKMIRGPQSTGLLFGRKDLIDAAKLNNSPHEAPIGRPMKVNKEEMFGMYAALKSYLERDHEKEWQDWLDRADRIRSELVTIPMNEVFRGRFGKNPPVRTTVATYGGVPGDSLVEMDCIASLD